MRCAQARRLFGAYWDDEMTQAEREWIESHFVACATCRREYGEFSRTLELAGSLPRVEPSPDLLERTLARTRQVSPAADRIPTAGVQWVPVTAAAAVLLILAMVVSPWIGLRPGPQVANRSSDAPLREAELVQPTLVVPPGQAAKGPEATLPGAGGVPSGPVAAAADSLFDPSEDVEFILDPVTLRRGRATMTRPTPGAQAEQAVITF
jgi:anti-sigma factor RsiW